MLLIGSSVIVTDPPRHVTPLAFRVSFVTVIVIALLLLYHSARSRSVRTNGQVLKARSAQLKSPYSTAEMEVTLRSPVPKFFQNFNTKGPKASGEILR